MAKIIIAGGGMSGMSLAWYIKKARPDYEVTVLEASDYAGGKACTHREDGFLCEKGVNGVLDNKPSTLGLAGELGLSPLKSNDAARKRFVVKESRLVPLPESPGSFLTSPLLSLPARLRVILEMVVPKGNPDVDESLADFARRRLGKEAFEYLIDPMSSGIYAGDPERLSLKSCFPRIYELEHGYGSLIRAMIRLKREAAIKGKAGPGAGPGGVLTSFRNGMSEMADRLSESLGSSLRTSSAVKNAIRTDKGWEVELEDGKTMSGSHLVLSCPAYVARDIMKQSAPGLSEAVSEIPYPPISVVCLGFRKDAIRNSLNGFGFLAPHCENRQILGALWDSSVFDNRAPEGFHLVRCLVGGARQGEIALLPDEKLVDVAIGECRQLMGLEKTPEFTKVFRWQHAIPQYNVGHARIIEKIEQELSALPGLYVRCNWIGGVSLNDCVANSMKTAGEICGGTDN